MLCLYFPLSVNLLQRNCYIYPVAWHFNELQLKLCCSRLCRIQTEGEEGIILEAILAGRQHPQFIYYCCLMSGHDWPKIMILDDVVDAVFENASLDCGCLLLRNIKIALLLLDR